MRKRIDWPGAPQALDGVDPAWSSRVRAVDSDTYCAER
jgi:hypothetical protein